MASLDNPRHEHFAQLIASGQTPAAAYVRAGYRAKAAYTCGPRLLKQPAVRARVDDLRQIVVETSLQRAAFNHEFVIRELMTNALKAQQSDDYSASNRALELLGRELGMFK